MARLWHSFGGWPGIRVWLIAIAVGLGFVVSGCSKPVHAPTREGGFVCTIPPLTAIVQEVAGDRAPVYNLLPPGSSPHTYEPRPTDAAAAEQALALFYVARSLDGWAARLNTPKRLAVMPKLPRAFRIAYIPHEHEDDDHGHDHDEVSEEEADPHFWSDPLAVQALLPQLTTSLVALDPGGREVYEKNAADFAARLDALHEEVAARMAPFAGESVILFHPSWCYFLDRYDMKVAALVEPAPGKERTPRYLRQVAEIAAAKQVKAIFSEPQLARGPAEVVAETTKLPLYELDPLGGVEGRMSYEELIRYNTAVLEKALQ